MSEIGYIRVPGDDKRIARGDDYAGDAWRNVKTGEIVMVAVGHSPASVVTIAAGLIRSKAATDLTSHLARANATRAIVFPVCPEAAPGG